MPRGRGLKTVRAEAAAAKSSALAPAKSAIPFWMWGAVAAALLFAFHNAYEARQLQEKVRVTELALTEQTRQQQQVAQQLALAHREALILTDPKSMWIKMPAGDKTLPVLQATWHQKIGNCCLRMESTGTGQQTYTSVVADAQYTWREADAVADVASRRRGQIRSAGRQSAGLAKRRQSSGHH